MTKHANHIDFIEFPAMSAESISSAKVFYSETFGWQFKDWGTDYADTASSGVGSGFNADLSNRPNQPLAVIYTPELEPTLSKVNAAGGIITKDIFSFPGGRRFHFIDPAGNELAVWSDK
jgi:uncharacterized protein